MSKVRPKKHLGQHFLNDRGIAQRIVDSLQADDDEAVIEVGPGMGVLTETLLKKYGGRFYAAEVDTESVEYLRANYPELGERLVHEDFLGLDTSSISKGRVAIIGNFPYNISSQIFFRVLDNRQQVARVVGMLQREVAQRLCQGPGSKVYGILSVLLQAYYDVEYLFTVSEGVFTPPPKVKSAVVRLTRNDTIALACDELLFFRVVKAGFNQRRKTLRNSIRAVFPLPDNHHPLLEKRPEQLDISQFVELTQWLQGSNG